MTTSQTLSMLKENEQDFEWYPTTDEMIKVVSRRCSDISSVLDVGAGDGRVLEQIDSMIKGRIKKFAIEKSIALVEAMPADISIVGTDFMLQTLIDKKVDAVFCNPPYSQYEVWATKIIKEANAKKVFLILPGRWKSSESIKKAVEQRNAKSKAVWSGNFLNAERQARAFVDIVEVIIHDEVNRYEAEAHDPFNVWFDEYFAEFAKLNPTEDEEEDLYGRPKPLKYELLEGQNLIERLYQLYAEEMAVLLNNYKTLAKLDTSLLRELGVKVDEARQGLKQKIEGLKNKYWNELFDNLRKITDRLTSGSRSDMLEKLRDSCNVDFSVDNAYAIVLWAIKNANKYIDKQLVDMFKELSEPECVKNYKSNQKTWEKEGWRYQKDHTKYMLEYRIITHRYSAIEVSYRNDCDLNRDCHIFINDIFTIANNLGFNNWADSRNRRWASNKEREFMWNSKTLVKIRAFKNGNLHLKFSQEFIKALNVEASRLLGWIKTPHEAAAEMGINLDFAKERFGSNLTFEPSECQKLLAG